MARSTSATGYQPRTTPGERRSDLDLQRRIAALERAVADLTARVVALESP